MTEENRENEICREIGELMLMDPRLAHGTWNAFSLVITSASAMNFGFIYDITGKVEGFSIHIPEHLFFELQEATKHNGQIWKACLLQVKASDWEMTWHFEFEAPECFLGLDPSELALKIRPEFKQDECWYCSLSHNILRQLRQEQPELVEDLSDLNLHCMITNSILKAIRHGLTSRSDLANFALTAFEIAPNFDTHPAVEAAFIKVKGLPGSVWNNLCAAVPEHVWAEMCGEHFYDGRAWFSELPQQYHEEVA